MARSRTARADGALLRDVRTAGSARRGSARGGRRSRARGRHDQMPTPFVFLRITSPTIADDALIGGSSASSRQAGSISERRGRHLRDRVLRASTPADPRRQTAEFAGHARCAQRALPAARVRRHSRCGAPIAGCVTLSTAAARAGLQTQTIPRSACAGCGSPAHSERRAREQVLATPRSSRRCS